MEFFKKCFIRDPELRDTHEVNFQTHGGWEEQQKCISDWDDFIFQLEKLKQLKATQSQQQRSDYQCETLSIAITRPQHKTFATGNSQTTETTSPGTQVTPLDLPQQLRTYDLQNFKIFWTLPYVECAIKVIRKWYYICQ